MSHLDQNLSHLDQNYERSDHLRGASVSFVAGVPVGSWYAAEGLMKGLSRLDEASCAISGTRMEFVRRFGAGASAGMPWPSRVVREESLAGRRRPGDPWPKTRPVRLASAAIGLPRSSELSGRRF